MFSKLYAEEAVANAAAPSQLSVVLMNLVPFILIFVVFYFLLIRPQSKKQKQHKAMLDAVKSGDKVVLNSGILGEVVKVKDDNYVVLRVSDNVNIEVVRSYIATIINDKK